MNIHRIACLVLAALALAGAAVPLAAQTVAPNGLPLPATVLHTLKSSGWPNGLDYTLAAPDGPWTIRGWFAARGMQVESLEQFASGPLTIEDLRPYSVVVVGPWSLLEWSALLGYQDVFEQYVAEGGGLLLAGQSGGLNTCCWTPSPNPPVVLDDLLGFSWTGGWYTQATVVDWSHTVMTGLTELPRSGGAFLDWDDFIQTSPLPPGATVLAMTQSPYPHSTNQVALLAFEHGKGRVVVGPADGILRPRGPTYVDPWYVYATPIKENTLLLNALAWLANQFPTASAGADRELVVGETGVFADAGSADPDGSIESWEWDFGDGATAEGPTVEHAWEAAGHYVVTLTVTDDRGGRGADTLGVSVLTPSEATAALAAQVGTLPLLPGIKQSLLAQLDAALAYLAEGQAGLAADVLQAFVNHVSAQRDKHIPAVTADELIARARLILAAL